MHHKMHKQIIRYVIFLLMHAALTYKYLTASVPALHPVYAYASKEEGLKKMPHKKNQDLIQTPHTMQKEIRNYAVFAVPYSVVSLEPHCSPSRRAVMSPMYASSSS